MKTETKLVGAVGVLPACADLLEDQNFNQQTKMIVNDLIASIRRFDNHFMRDADIELSEQQNNINLAFRQWLKSMEND